MPRKEKPTQKRKNVSDDDSSEDETPVASPETRHSDQPVAATSQQQPASETNTTAPDTTGQGSGFDISILKGVNLTVQLECLQSAKKNGTLDALSSNAIFAQKTFLIWNVGAFEGIPQSRHIVRMLVLAGCEGIREADIDVMSTRTTAGFAPGIKTLKFATRAPSTGIIEEFIANKDLYEKTDEANKTHSGADASKRCFLMKKFDDIEQTLCTFYHLISMQIEETDGARRAVGGPNGLKTTVKKTRKMLTLKQILKSAELLPIAKRVYKSMVHKSKNLLRFLGSRNGFPKEHWDL